MNEIFKIKDNSLINNNNYNMKKNKKHKDNYMIAAMPVTITSYSTTISENNDKMSSNVCVNNQNNNALERINIFIYVDVYKS